jgi:hypothetical protein
MSDQKIFYQNISIFATPSISPVTIPMRIVIDLVEDKGSQSNAPSEITDSLDLTGLINDIEGKRDNVTIDSEATFNEE